jgi:hypothetical protein
MNKTLKTLTLLVAGTALALPALAEMDHSKMDHGAMAAPGKAEGGMKGPEIRAAKVQDYQVKYTLMDLTERMKKMGMDPAKSKSHHLMVYYTGPDGKPAAQGKVGFAITGPDKSDQKTMAMGMGTGYGADVDLKAKGDYKLTVKAVFGDKTVMDEFPYTVK